MKTQYTSGAEREATELEENIKNIEKARDEDYTEQIENKIYLAKDNSSNYLMGGISGGLVTGALAYFCGNKVVDELARVAGTVYNSLASYPDASQNLQDIPYMLVGLGIVGLASTGLIGLAVNERKKVRELESKLNLINFNEEN